MIRVVYINVDGGRNSIWIRIPLVLNLGAIKKEEFFGKGGSFLIDKRWDSNRSATEFLKHSGAIKTYASIGESKFIPRLCSGLNNIKPFIFFPYLKLEVKGKSSSKPFSRDKIKELMKANKLFMGTQLAGPGMETNARTIITDAFNVREYENVKDLFSNTNLPKGDALSFLNLISDSERYFGKLYQQSFIEYDWPLDKL